MTELVWEKAWNLLQINEGGYQCLRNDRGNWTSGRVGVGELKGTKYGISAMSYPNLDIKNLTLDDAKKIYYKDYWLKYKCQLLPDALSIAVLDYAVNSGKQAIYDLQASLDIVIDGVIGNQTIGAANTKPIKPVLDEYMHRRLNFNVTRCDWKTFGKVWGERLNTVWNFCERFI